MTPRDALREATRECLRRFEYDEQELRDAIAGRIPDEWDTPTELEVDDAGICRDHAVWVIHRAYRNTDPPKPDLRVVVGTIPEGRHAWVELILPDGARIWSDPTPGNGGRVGPYTDFLDHYHYVPEYSTRFDGTIFSEPFMFTQEPTP